MQYPNLEFFCGRKKSGKDYCINGMIQELGGVRLSFSDELRHVANMIYPWCPLDPLPEDKEIPIDHPDNVHNMSPREIWLHLGSDTGLRYVNPSLFLSMFIQNQLPKVIDNPELKFFVTDVRTPQEYEWVKRTKCLLTRISTPDRKGIVEDDIESFIDQMSVDHEFLHLQNGYEPFIDFYRNK